MRSGLEDLFPIGLRRNDKWGRFILRNFDWIDFDLQTPLLDTAVLRYDAKDMKVL